MSLLLSLVAALVISTVSAGDDAALLAFKAQLNHDAVASWNSSAHFCSWEGVTCSHRHPARVVALSLYGSALTGALSPAIGNLTFLRTLNLSTNRLHGEIPASVGRLRRLRILELTNNSFSGTLPVNLSFCINMTVLYLDNNNLGGEIPAELGERLTSLKAISLMNNRFTGLIPASLANLSDLRYLEFSTNQLVGSIPPRLGSMQSIRYFSLPYNNLSGMLPPSLYNLSSLAYIDLSANMLYGSIPDDIGSKFPIMQVLSLGFNQFTGTIPSSLSNLSQLTEVLLGVNRFNGYVPPTLGTLQSVKYLELSGNRLGGYVPSTLGRLKALQGLHLAENSFEANDKQGWEFITSLANCTQLSVLILSENLFSGQLPGSVVNLSTTLQKLILDTNRISGSIPEVIGNLVGLSMLYIANNSISGLIPESIGKLENLVELYIYNNSLSGVIPSSLGNLSQLNRFYAYYNNLEGPIPASLGKLGTLFALDLSSNHRLNGSIPREILELPSLSWYLDLSYNSLSGPLPTEVGSLSNLNHLILSGNQLSGKVPDSIQNCVVLDVLLLDNNSFEGSIPKSLKNMKGLQLLNLTMNKFSGNIPDALGSIGHLQQLYLAHNNLSGRIPTALQNLTFLWDLDLSYNDLQGEVPKGGVFKYLHAASVTGNTQLCGGVPQIHLVPCSTHTLKGSEKHKSNSLLISLPGIGAILFLVLVTVIIWNLKQRRKIQAPPTSTEEQFPRVSYQALFRGTDGFSESNLLGKGRYGEVYKCILHDNDTPVAVKVFNLQQSGSSKSFEAECESLRRVRHRHLIKIITCCSSIDPQGQDFKALVLDLMPNGSLDGWLHPKDNICTLNNTLSLAQRLDIAVQVVDALEYLHNHSQQPIVHCDVKPGNILLGEDMSARVGDFGISRILPVIGSTTWQNSNSTIGIRGSIGYVAPEYGEGSPISTLGDVYSLGILLLEMVTGRSPTDDMFRDSKDLHKFTEAALPDRILEIADPTIWLHNDINDNTTRRRIQECLICVIRVGLSCSKQQPRERMLIRDVVAEMHAIRDANLRFIGSLAVGHGEREVNTLQRSAPTISN
nr:receptor kinase-like protein Xa21 [Lolium perenne]